MKKKKAHLSSTSRVTVERVHVLFDDQVEVGHLISMSQNKIHDLYVERENRTSQAYVEGERMPNHADVEGEHHISNPLVEVKPSGSNHDNGNDQNNDFHDVNDNISI